MARGSIIVLKCIEIGATLYPGYFLFFFFSKTERKKEKKKEISSHAKRIPDDSFDDECFESAYERSGAFHSLRNRETTRVHRILAMPFLALKSATRLLPLAFIPASFVTKKKKIP